jgi:hypothetical protein
MILGSCLCGGVRFEIDGALGQASHCHCSMCRKAHGAAFGTYAICRSDRFHLRSGAELVRRYESSPGIERTFCATCGSTLQWRRKDKPEEFDIALGLMDDDPGVRPSKHIYVGSKAPWFEITDDMPRHAEGGPS